MVLILLQLLPQLLRAGRTRWLPLGPLGLMTFLRKSGSLTLVAVWTKLLATIAWCSLCSGSRSCGTNFVVMCFMPRSSVKISVTVVLGIPRSASSSHTVSHRSLLITAYTSSTFSGVLLVAGLAECRSLSTDSQPSLKHLCHTFICVAVIASSLKTFWIIWILFVEECSSLMQNAHSFLYSFSHFESGGHTLHMLTWQCLPPHWPTSTVKSSLFTHVYSSPLCLATRIHCCKANCFHYINNGWTFSRQTSYVCVCVCKYICI